MGSRQVEIVVTNMVVGSYEARSYPDDQTDATGHYPLYSVPVYRIQVKGLDSSGKPAVFGFSAPRFMPYYNDPHHPDPSYKTLGWLNAGLSSSRRVVISTYKENYAVHNRFSPGRGAIVVQGTFYIHAGPSSTSRGWFRLRGLYRDHGELQFIQVDGRATLGSATRRPRSGNPAVSSSKEVDRDYSGHYPA